MAFRLILALLSTLLVGFVPSCTDSSSADGTGSGGAGGASEECESLDLEACSANGDCMAITGMDASGEHHFVECRYVADEPHQCGAVIMCGHPAEGDGPCLRFPSSCIPEDWTTSFDYITCPLRDDCPRYREPTEGEGGAGGEGGSN